MITYYVATLAHYVLVEAASESEARDQAQPRLQALRSEAARHLPVEIRTVRPASEVELELSRFDARLREPG